jgi:pilus assembly protein Flp/PilA
MKLMLKSYVAFQVYMATRNNKRSKGQSLAEYGLVLALIAVVCITALTNLGTQIKTMIEGLTSAIGTAVK